MDRIVEKFKTIEEQKVAAKSIGEKFFQLGIS
jgi:hypothetical protein